MGERSLCAKVCPQSSCSCGRSAPCYRATAGGHGRGSGCGGPDRAGGGRGHECPDRRVAGRGAPLPLLILDQRPEMTVRSGPSEPMNLSVSALLSMGLTLVTTISEQLAEAMDGQAQALAHAQAARPGPLVPPPAPAPGWRLELSARRAARLTAPDGPVIWGGECGQPRPWRALITRTSQCAVLIGAIGLYPTGERAPTRITTLLDQAAHAQELAGGLVEARYGQTA